MGIPVLILGETGSGKTFSIKNFDVNEVGIFSVEKGRLPFRDKGFKIVKNATYAHITKSFQDAKLKKYVIDDSQYLLVHELFDRVNETGYKKYTDMAVNFRNLIYTINHQLPEDVIVYFLHHVETSKETGKAKAKTVGQMIDQYLTLEGCFDIVLYAGVDSNGYYFVTQSDGTNTAKSPEEMFELKIDNDLKFVDTTIREYWNLKGEK
ncbi:MAG: AAA family ATPase [Lachnospiraceae bacterium]|nr:AAA family ATPase [Lachnospiraceae bacterium]